MSILDEIFAHKRKEVAAQKLRVPERELELAVEVSAVPPNFAAALRNFARPAPRLIAEVKHRSPSKGLLCPGFDPLVLAKTYAENGAAAISVLTDEKYFGGALEFLKLISNHFNSIVQNNGGSRSASAVRKAPPLLRKDFIFERYQLLEARANGASAALLIVAMLSDVELKSLITTANGLDLTPLVEVHTREELDRALGAGAKVIGINNRDLHTFSVSLDTTLKLRKHIPDEITIIAESGIKSITDVEILANAGIHAMLIGEGIVTAKDRGAKVRTLSQMNEKNSETQEILRGNHQWLQIAKIITDGDLAEIKTTDCPNCSDQKVGFSFAVVEGDPKGYRLFVFCRNCKQNHHFNFGFGKRPKNFSEDLVDEEFQELQNSYSSFVQNADLDLT